MGNVGMLAKRDRPLGLKDRAFQRLSPKVAGLGYRPSGERLGTRGRLAMDSAQGARRSQSEAALRR